MHYLIAPDSFKGTLSAAEVAEAMARGVERSGMQCTIDPCPVADGGEGTLDAFASAIGNAFTRHTLRVRGPLGGPVDADWGAVVGDDRKIAIIEMALASGLMLIPEAQRDPTRTTTFGTGELIRAAVEHGCEEVIVGIGGSATCDGGAGAAQALGVRFFDDSGDEIAQPIAGGDLESIESIEPPTETEFLRRTADRRLRIACDVDNPLCGPDGAAAVYAPQKGADARQVEELERGLAHLASLFPRIRTDQPGMGAAGGIALGLSIFAEHCGASISLESGIDLVLEAVEFERRVKQADLILSGEGSFDAQSLSGKAVAGVARQGKRHHVPTLVIAGQVRPPLSPADLQRMGIRHLASLTDRFGEKRAMAEPAACIETLTSEVVKSTQI